MKYKLFTFFVLIICSSGCKDIFEEPMDEVHMILHSPPDNFSSRDYSQVFWWEKVEGASQYHFQIVSPSFDSIVRIVLDSHVVQNKLTFSLAPDTFQWRVRAENSGSHSKFSKARNLYVLEGNFEDQRVELIGPENNTYFKSSGNAVTFNWASLFGSDNYRIQIDTLSESGKGELMSTTVSSNQYTHTFSNIISFKRKEFLWKVRGERESDEQTNSRWSSERRLIYLSKPDSVRKELPLMEGQGNELRWEVPLGSVLGDLSHYIIHVYSDKEGRQYLSGTFPFSTENRIDPLNTRYALSAGSNGQKVYWRVEAVDKAGNKSDPGDLWGFTIQR